MNRLIENIDKQIKTNQGKNIFLDNLTEFQFSKETIKSISSIDKLDSISKYYIIDYATDKAIEEFCRVNQYYSFSSKAKNDLRNIYSELFDNIQSKIFQIDEISKNHYENLKVWISDNNHFANELYNSSNKQVKPVACSEYSSELQLKILQIDIKNIIQPVLDIGCGSNGYLVNYFKKLGIEVFGIDRLTLKNPNLINADWLEFDYGTEKWGAIISNLGFSNHFIHHNLRKDGNYIEYARVYMKILNSLKIDGVFHYAPDLPFIEKYLDKDQFLLTKFDIDDYDFKTIKIKRLK